MLGWKIFRSFEISLTAIRLDNEKNSAEKQNFDLRENRKLTHSCFELCYLAFITSIKTTWSNTVFPLINAPPLISAPPPFKKNPLTTKPFILVKIRDTHNKYTNYLYFLLFFFYFMFGFFCWNHIFLSFPILNLLFYFNFQ